MGRRREVVVRESTGARVLEQSRARLLCVGLFFFLCFLSIALRLVEMMINAPAPPPREVASATREGEDPEEQDVRMGDGVLRRGDIVDRNGMLLATSLRTASAFANPREIRNLEEAAARLSGTLGMPRDVLLKRLKKGKSFVWIKRGMTPAEQQAVNNLGIPGVYFQAEEKRVYPYGNLFSHTVGYVGVDNEGLAGIEKHFNGLLRDEQAVRKPLTLSLDARVQHALRDELSQAVQEFSALGATGVVLDARSGEVVAMVSLPDFDPHRPARARDEQKFNRATLGTYEMGSTFKTFTLAMALDAGVTSLKGGYDASQPLKLAGATISDSHPKSRWLSVPEIYAYSSNIGTARILLDSGVKRQKLFMEKLGMLTPLEVELPERASPLYPKDWRELSAVTISYGHGISVSPLHLARGIAAVVRGGTLPALTLVRQPEEQHKKPGERVVSEETSRAVARLMRMVVVHGTGGKADVPGYRVGGKTGTAEKIQAGGGYSKGNNLASFVAAFPVDDPAYVVLVMVDEPKGTKATSGYATGGWVAAPVAGRVIARMGPMLGLAPDYSPARDDAEQYWVSTERKAPAQTASTGRKNYLHAASFPAR